MLYKTNNAFFTTLRVWYVLNDITLISHDGCRFPLVINNITEPSYGMVAQVLALPPHSKKVMGSITAWGAVGSGGQVLPRPSVLRWAISRAFQCRVYMFSPCSQGVSSTKHPNRKNMLKNRKRSLSCPSLTKTDMIT